MLGCDSDRDDKNRDVMGLGCVWRILSPCKVFFYTFFLNITKQLFLLRLLPTILAPNYGNTGLKMRQTHLKPRYFFFGSFFLPILAFFFTYRCPPYPMSRTAGLKRHVLFFFFFCFLFISLLIIICAVTMHHHYTSPLHIATTHCHYASPLHIATTHCHYASPLHIATTHCRYNCNITHWQEKAQDSKHDHPKRLCHPHLPWKQWPMQSRVRCMCRPAFKWVFIFYFLPYFTNLLNHSYRL